MNREVVEEMERHPFEGAPHRTLLALSTPVLFSLIAEPLTALTDTAFVARLGATSLASLGVGATLLSGVFWVFNFLGIGVQTAVAQAMGKKAPQEAARVSTLGFLVAMIAGAGLILLGFLATPSVVSLMGATGELARQASTYMYFRWLGAPAVLGVITAFGVLRGRMDMRTPLWIALGINTLNILLDALLIFGLGPIPALGIQGAAMASSISQWAGAVWAFKFVVSRVGLRRDLQLGETLGLLRIGGDLFVRTGLLNLFLILATRTATVAGEEAGAAHQAIRQFWVFTALLLDAFAVTCQSLVGFFVGKGLLGQARRAAAVTLVWSTGIGALMGAGMLVGQSFVVAILVPATSVAFFLPAWWVSALSQPLNAVAFATDGIHWGTGDFRFLRNVVLFVSAISFFGLSQIDSTQAAALIWVWIVTTIWVGARGILGVLRIWPGIGKAPLKADYGREH
jgi:MATE family multidrug resistance protein